MDLEEVLVQAENTRYLEMMKIMCRQDGLVDTKIVDRTRRINILAHMTKLL